ERDFWGGSRSVIRHILKAFTADDAVRFFADLGVRLSEEPDGKLFPVTNHARDVLTALVRAAEAEGAQLLSDSRVVSVERERGRFHGAAAGGRLFDCTRLVLATGGRSVPKTGSDGAGYEFAHALGHTIVPTTAALTPLVLDEERGRSFHRELSGVSHDA